MPNPQQPDTSPKAVAKVLRKAITPICRLSLKEEDERGERWGHMADELQALAEALDRQSPREINSKAADAIKSLSLACEQQGLTVSPEYRALADALERQAGVTLEDRRMNALDAWNAAVRRDADSITALYAALSAFAPEYAPAESNADTYWKPYDTAPTESASDD